MKRPQTDYTLIIDISKHRDSYGSNTDKLRTFRRKLKLYGWKVVILNRWLDKDILEKYDRSRSVLLVLAADATHSSSEIEAIGQYLKRGGRVFITLSSHYDNQTDVNEFIKTYGVSANNDCVLRTNRFKYNHPKEVIIKNGVNRGILEDGAKLLIEANLIDDVTKNGLSRDGRPDLRDLKILYPYGATLNVENPSIVAMSTSKFSLPVNQAICSFFDDSVSNSRLVIIGSTQFFYDEYIGSEQNMLLGLIILEFLVNTDFKINLYNAKIAEIEEYCQIPDLNHLSELPLSCFQDSEQIPEDVHSLVEQKLFVGGSSILPKTLEAYEHLDIKHEKLTLIRPRFETPLPKLRPATCSPILRGPTAPKLEFFDLDQEFMPVRTRLMEVAGSIVGKTLQDDKPLEDLIRNFATIVRVIGNETKSPKELLDYVFKRVVNFKMVDVINI